MQSITFMGMFGKLSGKDQISYIPLPTQNRRSVTNMPFLWLETLRILSGLLICMQWQAGSTLYYIQSTREQKKGCHRQITLIHLT